MNVTIEGHRNKFRKWKEDFVSIGMKVELRKTKIIVSQSITRDGPFISKVNQCGIYNLMVKAISVLCVKCIG